MGLRIGDEPVPNYRLVRFLGRGGFGQVWAATSPGGIHVALKIIDLSGREGVKEFKALRLMKSIRQANLTPILAFWLKDEDGQLVDESQVGNDLSSNAQPTSVQGTVLINSLSKMRPDELIIAMGLGDKTLSDRLRECNEQGLAGIPPDELFNYMIDAARAIDFLNTPRHDLGHGPISPIQHCDIKPQNILIVGDTAQVCDFGLARELGTNVKMTSAAVSPAYGAPELIEGRPPSGATDQYSLAITYVELRTGGLPFADPDSYLHVVNAHLYGGLDLNGLTAAEQEVIRKATSREPADRYESALKMVKALRQACPDDGGSMRVMPSQSRQITGAQVGSDLNVTMPLPGASTGNSTIPVPLMPQKSSGLTETPGVRVGVTKVDSRLAATTTHLDDALAIEAERSRKKRGRIWKTAAALGVLGVVIAAAVYVNRPRDPKAIALQGALADLLAGVREPDLKKQAGYFFDAFRGCQKYANDPELRRTMDDADASLQETWAKVVKQGNGLVLPVADRSPSDAKLIEGIDYFDQYLKEFEDAPGIELIKDARKDIALQAAKRFVDEGESSLQTATIATAALTDITRKFAKAAEIVNDEYDELYFRAKLGLARVAARQGRFSLDDAQYLDTKLHELRGRVKDVGPLFEAQIHVLCALAEREKSKDDPGPALQALKKLYPVGIRLLRNPALGGTELAHVDELLAWAGGLPSLTPSDSEIIRDLQSEGIGQAVDEAHSKFQSIVQSKDLAERTAPLQSLREVVKRGLASNDPATKHSFEELRALADLVDPQAPETDVTNAVAWFAAATAGQQLHMSHWTEALIDLTSRDPAQLGPAIEALEKHAGEAKVIATLPNLYQQHILRLVKEPAETKDYFALLAGTGKRLRDLGADNRLSNLARAEGLQALHSGKPTRGEQTQAIRDSLASAERQTAVAEQAMYEKYVRLLVGLDGAVLKDADRGELKKIMDAATQAAPEFGFAVESRRAELARLAVRAAASVRAGADGTLDIAAIAHPYGKGGDGPQRAYEFLKGAVALSPHVDKDAQYKANWLLAAWHTGSAGRQVVTDKHRKDLIAVLSSADIADHERFPLLYVRGHFPLVAGDAKDQSEAMDSMSTLFEALLKADVEIDNPDVLELAKRADDWVEQLKQPRPTDKALRLQLARLAYTLERLLADYQGDAHSARRDKRLEAYGLAVELNGENADYLGAHGFACLDADPPLMDKALEDAEKLQRLAPESAASQGLMAYVKLQQARRESNLQQQAELARDAVKYGEAAIEATKDGSYLATYHLHLGDSYVALANFGPDEEAIQAAALEKAIEHANAVLELSGVVYKHYANIILGNACEDLAWLAEAGGEKQINENYERAIAAFEKVAETDPVLGNMNLGRCYYKREADSRQVGKGYLDKAKVALDEALKNRPEYAEAHRWLAAVHEKQGNLKLALEHFAKAAQLAKEQHSYNYSHYLRYWARVAVESMQPAAPLREQLRALLQDPDLQAPNVQKELALRIAMTHEKERAWKEAIEVYTRHIDEKPTVLDADLLRGRAVSEVMLAMAKAQKNEAAVDEFRASALDWNQVVLLMGDKVSWSDLFQKAVANQAYWSTARGTVPGLTALDTAVKAYDSAIRNIDRQPKGVPLDLQEKAQVVFRSYVALLSQPDFRKDFARMPESGRTAAKDAEKILGKAAGKVSKDFQRYVSIQLMTPEFRKQLNSL